MSIRLVFLSCFEASTNKIYISRKCMYIVFIMQCHLCKILFNLVFSGVCVTRSLALYVCFVDRCLSFCTFSFGHCVVCSSIYGFWLPLWYLQTLLTHKKKKILDILVEFLIVWLHHSPRSTNGFVICST
jgi:hypothetical protein